MIRKVPSLIHIVLIWIPDLVYVVGLCHISLYRKPWLRIFTFNGACIAIVCEWIVNPPVLPIFCECMVASLVKCHWFCMDDKSSCLYLFSMSFMWIIWYVLNRGLFSFTWQGFKKGTSNSNWNPQENFFEHRL